MTDPSTLAGRTSGYVTLASQNEALRAEVDQLKSDLDDRKTGFVVILVFVAITALVVGGLLGSMFGPDILDDRPVPITVEPTAPS